MRTGSYSLVLIGLLLMVGGSYPIAAQTDRATLEGTVTDPSGSALQGANVHITAVDTGLTQDKVSNANGHYRFPALAVGEYTMVVSREGFRTKEIEEIVLQVGETHTLDATLQVGIPDQKVVVQAEVAPYERSSAESATVIRDDQIENLPTNGRDWAGLTLLAPFAQDDGGGDQRTIRFAGRARDDNNFSFDGVDAGGIQEQAQKSQTRLQISEDAVEEYRVDSALYDAEYGTQAGGQVNVVTKSGTNEFHGSVFGYLRNSAFDARNFNDGPSVAPFRMGQYGLALGGPIHRDHTFFFINYEGLRQYQGQTLIAAVPTAEFLNQVLVTGNGGLGPSPQMCSIMQAYPWRASTGTVGGCAPRFAFPDSFFPNTPQSGDVAENFTHVAPTTVHEDTWLVRVDHKFSDKTTLYGRAQRDISLVDGPQGNSLDLLRAINHPANYVLALQHTFTVNLANEVKVYVNRSPFQNPQASTLPYSVSTASFETINNNQADIEIGTTYGFVDNLTWTHGRHTFKTGMEFRRVRLNQGKTESNSLTFANDIDMVTATLAGVNFTSSWCCHKLRRAFYMPYFQDEWKVTPTLTLNLGIRWEYYGVAQEADNRTTVFDFTQFHGVCRGSGSTNTPFPTPVNTPACPQNPALYNPDYRNFDPRVSFAWAPATLHGKTVIRSGFGIYHGAAQNDDLNAGLESDTFIGTVPGPLPLDPRFQRSVPDLTGYPPVANQPRGLQRQGRYDLYAEEWGLTIEQALPGSFVFSASYLGSHGVRLFSKTAVNFCVTEPDPNTGACTRPLDQYYPDPQNPGQFLQPFGSVDLKQDDGTSSYHGLALSLERRYSNGLSFQGRYTWSHSINDGAIGGGEADRPEDLNCRKCDIGPSVFDIRHNIAVNGIYALPVGSGKKYVDKGVAAKVLEGWSLSSVGLWHTGHPLTVFYDVQPYQLADGNDQSDERPDIVPGVPLYLPGGGKNFSQWINPAAFTAPPLSSDPTLAAAGVVSRYGNEPRGFVRALHSWQVDMALMKESKLTERFALEFGVQAFNILNHVQLGDPAKLKLKYNNDSGVWGTVAGSDFGIINGTVNFNNNNDNAASPNTGTGLPRQIQFMLRFKF